jgi:hypothetical protein
MRPGREISAGSILVGTVGSQDEQHLGILSQPVHLVQQFVEENLLAGPMHMRAFASGEIHILDYHHGRLQETCQPKVFTEQAQLLCCYQQGEWFGNC